MKIFFAIALILLVIGGINRGLIGLFAFDAVSAIFGFMTMASRFLYILIGLSAVYIVISQFSEKK